MPDSSYTAAETTKTETASIDVFQNLLAVTSQMYINMSHLMPIWSCPAEGFVQSTHCHSLHTPPCSEVSTWLVFEQRIGISKRKVYFARCWQLISFQVKTFTWSDLGWANFWSWNAWHIRTSHWSTTTGHCRRTTVVDCLRTYQILTFSKTWSMCDVG